MMMILGCALQSACVFATENVVRYEDFGAKGDGKTDDIAAIANAHAHANQCGLPVRADDEATYYIGRKANPVTIRTDTDFGNAQFIIDDRDVEDRNAHIFEVRSTQSPLHPEGISSLKAGQRKIDDPQLRNCVVCVTDSNIAHYIRKGLNPNNGKPQTDVFLVDENGTVDAGTPILWDFDRMTDIVAYPVDETPLKITGGRFTTIANTAESKYNYHSRGIEIQRSNVLVDGLEHRVTGEGDHGAPYRGFIYITDCANVTVRNTTFTGHKTYVTIGRANKPVPMGSYDFSVRRALNTSFINCRQFNDINDKTYWGIMSSNYSKNLLYDNCSFSRFDAHMGVANGTIRNSTLGHMGINAIGHGTLTVENTTVSGKTFINLRSDYGSTWQGEFIIRNCIFAHPGNEPVRLIRGRNDEQHNFGYTCHMPERITVDGLHIDDSRHPENYDGPAIFADFNPQYDPSVEKPYAYIKPRKVILKNVTTASGLPLRTSDNPVMFNDVIVTKR
jgi:hypothetical protein